jgi:hypothetical protein
LANIYEWAEAGSSAAVRVRTALVPYTTRVLVRRPIDRGKFSGRVIVELLNPSGLYDFAPLWGFSYAHFMRSGDVWVGVTVKPVAAATLQQFDSVRYAQLNFSYKQAQDCKPAPTGALGADSRDNSTEAENGLAWDLIAQVGALLRSSSKENPLLPYNPQRVVVAGYSQTGGYLVNFVNALHAQMRMGDGKPIFDAYVNAASSVTPPPINQCAALLAPDDPRRDILPRDVPVITVKTQSDFNRGPERRADTDKPEDVFRLYEIAGAAHSGPFPAGQPSAADLQIAGISAPDASVCKEQRSDFPLGFAFSAIWMQLDDYLVRKVPLARVPRIAIDAQAAPVVDAQGNVHGGWRLPQLDVPLARYSGRSSPVSTQASAEFHCALTGSMQRLEAPKLKALHGDRAGYLRRFNAAVDLAVQDRRLVIEDAIGLKNPVIRTLPAF